MNNKCSFVVKSSHLRRNHVPKAAMLMGSVVDNTEFPKTLEAAFAGATKFPITYTNRKGFFISERRFRALHELVDDATDSISDEDKAAFERIKAERADAQDTIDQLQKHMKKQETDFNSYVEQINSVNKANEASTLANVEAATKLRGEVKMLEKERAELQNEVSRVQAQNDVDKAAPVAEEMKRVRAELKSKRNELDKVQKDNVELTRQVMELNSKRFALGTKKESTRKELAIARAAYDQICDEDLIQRPFSGSAAKVSKLLGKKGLQWFAKAELASREDAREKAYNLLMALKSSNSKPIHSLEALVQIVFDWIKKQAWKVRQRVVPWLEMVSEDIKNGTLQTLKFYNDQLEKIIGVVKLEVQKAHKEYKERKYDSWFSKLWSTYGSAFVNLGKSIRASKFSWKSVKKVVATPFQVVASWFQRKPVRYRHAFVADDEEVTEVLFSQDDEKLIVMLDNEIVPPEGSKPPSKGKAKA